MNNTIQVKCYLFANNSNVSVSSKLQSEIRIFNLTFTSWTGIFCNLVKKIQLAYDALALSSSDIKTYWQDDEEELICFSTDDELRYAINIFKTLSQKVAIRKKSDFSNFLRIYIARNQQQSVKQQQQKVTNCKLCNECKGCIIGEINKCNICSDYCLCNECKKKGVHKIHMFSKEKSLMNSEKSQGVSPKKLNDALMSASQSVPVVKTDEQLKFAGDVLKRLFEPLEINIELNNDDNDVNNNRSTSKQINIINTEPDQLKKIGENLRSFLETRGMDVSYLIKNTITCNSCREQINDDGGGGSGNRYKCTKCVDYDLCEQCQKKGVHKEHLMVKVNKKNNNDTAVNHNKNLKYCFSCNDQIIGSRFKCKTCLNHEICEICEKKGLQKPHIFHKISSNNIGNSSSSRSSSSDKDSINENSSSNSADSNQLNRTASRNITTPAAASAPTGGPGGVRFKFSSRLSYNFTENKDKKTVSRSESRLEAASSIEEFRLGHKQNKKEYFDFKSSKKVIKSSGGESNSDTDVTLSPSNSELILDKTISLLNATSTKKNINQHQHQQQQQHQQSANNKGSNIKNQNIDIKVMKLKTSSSSKLSPPTAASTTTISRSISRLTNNNNHKQQHNKSVTFDESDYDNIRNKTDCLNISSFSSDISIESSSSFDSDIDFDKELQILDTLDRLRTLGYQGNTIKRLVDSKNGNFNLVLDTISQRPNYWIQNQPKKFLNNNNNNNVTSKSYRL